MCKDYIPLVCASIHCKSKMKKPRLGKLMTESQFYD